MTRNWDHEARGWHIPKLTINYRLMLARLDAGMSQQELAAATGMSRGTITNYERGSVEPRRVGVNSWALATGVPPEWLLTGRGGDGDDDGPASSGANLGLVGGQIVPLRPSVSCAA